jgi:hypothetical protein
MHPMAPPWAVAMAQMVSWFILSGLFLFSKDNGFFTKKREMVIQLMGFYRNFVQIDNG